MSETLGQRRFVGAVWFIAALGSLIAAFIVQPVADWGSFGVLLALLVALLGLTGLFIVVTGKGRILGTRTSLRTQKIFAIIGLIAATVLAVLYLVGDWSVWTAVDVLTIGVWVSIGVMFVVSLIAVNSIEKRA
jgi:nicotinamide riboside transporter PnuC